MLKLILKLMAVSRYLLTFTLLFFFPQAPILAQNVTDKPPVDLSSIFIIDCNISGQYSLYSYFLFPRQPVFNAHTNALKQTEQLLRKIHKLKQRYTNTPTHKQHAFYIPVSFEPQSWVMQPTEDDFNAAARWVVRNFDYQCAKKLLTAFPRIKNDGPYLLSSTKKLRQKSPWRPPVLTQDFSKTGLNDSLFWIETFFKKSWQPQHWGATDLLSLRESMLEILFNRHRQNMKNSVQIPVSLPIKSLQTELETNDPVNKTPPIEYNPYLDRITIQLKREQKNKLK